MITNSKYLTLKEKSKTYSPSILSKILGFYDSLTLAYDMLNNDEWDESLQEYATEILEELRKKYPTDWNNSWKYDAFLGYAYHIILEYDKRYEAYKRAFNKIQPPPPQLLVAMARCCIAPGKPPIAEDEAIMLVKQAIKDTLYVEAVELLRGLYKSIGNIKEQQHWERILDKIKDTGPHLPSLDQIFNS